MYVMIVRLDCGYICNHKMTIMHINFYCLSIFMNLSWGDAIEKSMKITYMTLINT